MNITSTVNYTSAMYTTSVPSHDNKVIIGYVTAILSAIGYGINYIPVKKYETGDGLFFQWIFGSAIFIGSFITHNVLKFPKFEPLVMVGGVLWALGNICSVPIIKKVGLSIGLMIWACTSIVVGWVTTRFGLFGIKPQLPTHYVMNYFGFIFILISPIFSSLVKPDLRPIPVEIPVDVEESTPLLSDPTDNIQIVSDIHSNWKDRLIGVLLSVFAGTCYGLMFIPVIRVKDAGGSQNDIDHLFAQCCGIYITSSAAFLIYCFIKKNKPQIYPESLLPSFASGTIWFLAYICYFQANSGLDAVISQPIVSAVTGLISVLVGTFIFREFKGYKNYALVFCGLVFSLIGVTLTALSK